ncbi:hypothetical protein BB561_002498 [Smittium simulii]|uniref:Flavin-nucleotide-binding protein n=1 Tax=Smittium simulii TaxID=133385 RepID=A0A2T9YQ76_9FUNG|nr:hypothetical protein BB561_002498 [Smittium simulii]
MADYTPSSKSINFINRARERGTYDQESVYRVLDQGLVSHVGFHSSKNADEGEAWPFVIPMIYGRIEDTVYLHGYMSGRLIKDLGKPTGPRTCITVTHVDGLVVALSSFHNSNNYRSVCVFGNSRLVTDPEEKLKALKAINNHQFKGQDNWGAAREVNSTELKTTNVIAVKIETASVKQRFGGPSDDKQDLMNEELLSKTWVGVVPIKTVLGAPIPADYNKAPIPEYLQKFLEHSKETV